jgi:hypothetical protein
MAPHVPMPRERHVAGGPADLSSSGVRSRSMPAMLRVLGVSAVTRRHQNGDKQANDAAIQIATPTTATGSRA